jgi:acyl-CoA synthetase (AMP-forming)/AMP-acid ligase II
MSRPPTLVEALRSRSRLPRDDQLVNFPIIYVENGVEILRESFSDIYEGAREYLAALQRIGIKQGDYVLLQTPSRAKHFRAFWGCALGGIVPVTVAVPVNFDRNSALVGKICGVLNTLVEVRSCLILTEDSVFEDLSSCISLATKRKIEIYSVDSFAKNPDANMCVEATVKPSDVLFLQLTSGSTGVPKCIQETHDGVIHQILGSAEVCGYAHGKTTLNWLPFDHVVPMLTCHLRDIYLGLGFWGFDGPGASPNARSACESSTLDRLLGKVQG